MSTYSEAKQQGGVDRVAPLVPVSNCEDGCVKLNLEEATVVRLIGLVFKLVFA